jgi:hypothetical protein
LPISVRHEPGPFEQSAWHAHVDATSSHPGAVGTFSQSAMSAPRHASAQPHWQPLGVDTVGGGRGGPPASWPPPAPVAAPPSGVGEGSGAPAGDGALPPGDPVVWPCDVVPEGPLDAGSSAPPVP